VIDSLLNYGSFGECCKDARAATEVVVQGKDAIDSNIALRCEIVFSMNADMVLIHLIVICGCMTVVRRSQIHRQKHLQG
jgi:hypothetical protein